MIQLSFGGDVLQDFRILRASERDCAHFSHNFETSNLLFKRDKRRSIRTCVDDALPEKINAL